MSVSGTTADSRLPRVLTMSELDSTRWAAVKGRDKSLDGVFVYAVTSSGVFCRPGCSSRTPRRENVAFFPGAQAARDAGFRACRRCRPEETSPRDAALDAVISLCRRLEEDPDADVATVARELGYSERHLRRRFGDVVGVSVSVYARDQRARRVRETLASSGAVSEALYDAGYGSSRAFYEHGAPRLAMAPRTYRAGGRGEAIVYTTFATPLGRVLCARTDRGVCAVRIGGDDAALAAELASEFAQATIVRDDAALAQDATMITALARGEGEAATLPLDLRGTVFQMRVWETLRGVVRGTTLTYGELAERIGSPKAVRAVGSACGANPVALVVPCHRVLRSDGTLGGYRWGLETKEALLAAESDAAR